MSEQSEVIDAAEEQAQGGAADDPPTLRMRARRRNAPRRGHFINVKLSDEEFNVVKTAANRGGLTTTGYVAQMAVEVARGTVKPLPTSIGAVVRELIDATTQLRRYGVLLNQAVAKLNATGEASVALPSAIERCDVAVAAIRDAVVRLASTR